MEDDDVVSAESPPSRRPVTLFSTSSVTVILLGCVGMVEYSLVMPSMSSYVERLGGDDVFYGMSIAAFSAFRVLFMPVLGWWSDKRPMIEPFVFSICLALGGNLLYACAEWAGTKWFVFFGRALVGLGAANSTLSMSYITRITTSDNRTRALATLNGINLLGIVMGPATNLLITWTLDSGIDGLQFNKYTNPGFAMFVILLIILFVMVSTFEEPQRLAHTSPLEEPLLENGIPETARGTWLSIYTDLFWNQSLWVHFVISFVSNFILAELETALPDMTSFSYGWDALENSVMYASIGMITAGVLVLTGKLSKRVTDRAFIRFGTCVYGIALVLGCVFLREPKPPIGLFSVVAILLVVAAPMTDSPNMSCYSKRLQTNDGALPFLGLFIGFIQASNGVSRTVAPLFAGAALTFKSDTYFYVFLGPMVVWVVSFAVLACKYSSMSVVSRGTSQALPRSASGQSILESPALLISSPMIASTPFEDFHMRRVSIISEVE